jgi:hypothetical protein
MRSFVFISVKNDLGPLIFSPLYFDYSAGRFEWVLVDTILCSFGLFLGVKGKNITAWTVATLHRPTADGEPPLAALKCFCNPFRFFTICARAISKQDSAALTLASNAKFYFARLLRYVFKNLDLHVAHIKTVLALFFPAVLREFDFRHFLSLLT